MSDKSKMRCGHCQGAGAMQAENGQVYGCPNCGGAGVVPRAEVSPYDYAYNYLIPASGSINISVQILSWDFLLKWLIASTATPADAVQVTDNNGRQWSNLPIQIQNWAGSGSLPFPVQPNWLQKKNTTLTLTVTGAVGDSGQLVLRGINLADVVAVVVGPAVATAVVTS